MHWGGGGGDRMTVVALTEVGVEGLGDTIQ